jgi:hypothetical protein
MTGKDCQEDRSIGLPPGMKLMSEKAENLDLTAKQKTRLLSLGLSSEASEANTDSEEKRADLLYDILVRTLPVDGYIVDSLPPILRSLSGRLRSVAGEPLADLLQNPRTDISVIEKIKNYAKDYPEGSGTSGKSKAERDIFLTIYFAAIASAFLFHNKKITQHSYEGLKRSFSSYAQKSWVLDELRIHFKRAHEYCQKTQEG